MKKVYNQPFVEMVPMQPNVHVMFTVSEGGDPPGGGAHAPAGRGDLIP